MSLVIGIVVGTLCSFFFAPAIWLLLQRERPSRVEERRRGSRISIRTVMMGSRRGGAPLRIQGVGSGLRGGEKVLRRGRHRKHFRRYRQIVEVFLRHGFGYTVERLDLGHLIPMWRRFRRVQEGRATGLPAVRLRSAFEELGATFIKLGQLLSTRADLVRRRSPGTAKLQDEVAPFPTEEAVALIEAELGIALDDAFAHFDGSPWPPDPSRKCTGRWSSGEEVVVKLQRPGVAAQIRTDVEILSGLARIVQDRLRPEMVNIVDFVDEFRRYIMNELDLPAKDATSNGSAVNSRTIPTSSFRRSSGSSARTAC